jgi:Cys-tRNA synthase (O-phospho-L-seryl-tRNA:Cys-tRNA synthase)
MGATVRRRNEVGSLVRNSRKALRNPTTSSVCDACAGAAARRVRDPATAAFSTAALTFAGTDADAQTRT